MQPNEMVLSGAQDLVEAKKAQTNLNNFIASMMRDGTDYGEIPGTHRKSLWQPGAQKLLYFNGLGAKMACTEKVQDWEKGFFHYEFKATVFHKRTGLEVAECYGSANSKEDRYAWRWVSDKKIPKGVDKDDLVTQQRDGKYGPYTAYRIENQDKFTLANTLKKMAQKRALIGASLLACRAAENFTQDIEEEDAGQTAPTGAPEGKGPAKAKDVTPPKEKSTTKPEGAISEPQLKRLKAIKAKAKVSDADLKPYLEKNHPEIFDKDGKCHLSWIHWKNYKALCEHVEWMGEQPPSGGE